MTDDEIRDRQAHETDPGQYHSERHIGPISCRWCLGVDIGSHPTVASAEEPDEPTVVDVQPTGGIL